MKLVCTIVCLFMGSIWAQTTAPADPPAKSRVVWIERAAVIDKFAVNAEGVNSMFVKALQVYTGQKNVGRAWAQLGIQPNDIVGIKINASMGSVMSTRRALVDVVLETLQSAGVPPGHIFVWDKFGNDLESAGWLPQREGDLPMVKSVIPGSGFDGQQFYVNEIMGKLIWGDFLFRGKKPGREELLRAAEKVVKKHADDPQADPDPNVKKNEIDEADQTSNKSYLASLVTQTFTKIINIPVMSDHDDWGISGCLSSLAMSSVDNTRRFADDEINGDPAIPEILERDVFKKKVVLHIMDGLIAEYAGGPQFVPQYTQSIGCLYLSTDPVAIDSLVLPRLEDWRKSAQVIPIKDMARHLKTAAQDKLGQDDLKNIDLIQVK